MYVVTAPKNKMFHMCKNADVSNGTKKQNVPHVQKCRFKMFHMCSNYLPGHPLPTSLPPPTLSTSTLLSIHLPPPPAWPPSPSLPPSQPISHHHLPSRHLPGHSLPPYHHHITNMSCAIHMTFLLQQQAITHTLFIIQIYIVEL